MVLLNNNRTTISIKHNQANLCANMLCYICEISHSFQSFPKLPGWSVDILECKQFTHINVSNILCYLRVYRSVVEIIAPKELMIFSILIIAYSYKDSRKYAFCYTWFDVLWMKHCQSGCLETAYTHIWRECVVCWLAYIYDCNIHVRRI